MAAIGMAGENRVDSASIEQGRSSASRGGIGAVMGDKGLKAIVVRGTKDINVARPAEFLGLCNEVMKYIKFRNENPIPGVMPILAGLGSPQEMAVHDEKWHTENFMWGNSRPQEGFLDRRNRPSVDGDHGPDADAADQLLQLPHDMRGDHFHARDAHLHDEMLLKAHLYHGRLFRPGVRLEHRSARHRVRRGRLSSAPQVMAFALELYEAGILTDEDMPGLPSDNEERFNWLLDRIVRREGIGDVLANGTYWAAQQIGKGAEAYAHNNIKKHEQLPLKLSMLNPIYFLMYATGEKINITQIEGQFPQAPFMTREEREEFVKDWVQVPDEKFKQYLLDWEPRGEKSMPFYPTVKMCCDIVDWQERMHYIDDALGMCAGLSSFPLKPPYHIHNYPKFISAGAGIDMDEAKLTQATKRYRTLVRANNIRRGMRRKDEKPPEDHWKKRFPELEKELLDTYYKFKGWNDDGIPTTETLQELGLDYVSEEFLQRGILTAGAGASSKETSPKKRRKGGGREH